MYGSTIPFHEPIFSIFPYFSTLIKSLHMTPNIAANLERLVVKVQVVATSHVYLALPI